MMNPSTKMPSRTRLNFHMSFMPSSLSWPCAIHLAGAFLGSSFLGSSFLGSSFFGAYFSGFRMRSQRRITSGVRHHGAPERRVAQSAREAPLEHRAVASGEPGFRFRVRDLVIDDQHRRRLEPRGQRVQRVDVMLWHGVHEGLRRARHRGHRPGHAPRKVLARAWPRARARRRRSSPPRRASRHRLRRRNRRVLRGMHDHDGVGRRHLERSGAYLQSRGLPHRLEPPGRQHEQGRRGSCPCRGRHTASPPPPG